MRTACYSLLGTVGIMLAAACGGESGGITTPPPPPPTEELQIFFLQPSNNSTMSGLEAKIVVTVSATSNLKTINPSDVSITANGVTVSGFTATLPAVIGSNKVTATVVGKSKSLTKEIEVQFSPRLACKAYVANPTDESIGQAQPKVTYSKGSSSTTVTVGQNGDCSLSGNMLATEDGLSVSVSDASGRTHGMTGAITKADMAKGITLLLAPRSLVISGGPLNGQAIEIDVGLACKAGPDGSSFYNCIAGNGGWTFHPVSAPSPLASAIMNNLSSTNQTLDSAGEANIWKAGSYWNTTLGKTNFRQANASDVGTTTGVRFVVDSTQTKGYAAAGVAFTNGYDIVGGAVFYYRAAGASGPGNTEHELGHVLGLGHGCGWNGLMSACGYTRPNTLTAQDVAYIQLWTRLADLSRKYNITFSNWTVMSPK